MSATGQQRTKAIIQSTFFRSAAIIRKICQYSHSSVICQNFFWQSLFCRNVSGDDNMGLLEAEGCTPDFRYRMRFSRKLSGWMVHHVQVLHRGVALVPAHTPQGFYATESELLDHVFSWCDSVAQRLIADMLESDGSGSSTRMGFVAPFVQD
ncbi:hypothetical protein [Herbaspirillum robiniae]|uniref:hypothetical protein n=1 Tax=Herbaspirillum robiniae TaxID=2014887 RepID=UPI003D7770E0